MSAEAVPESEENLGAPLPALQSFETKMKRATGPRVPHVPPELSISDSSATNTSQSATLLSTHAMKMGLYNINLGSATGQKLHTCHLIVLPLIPVAILLAQNTAVYVQNNQSMAALEAVATQVENASRRSGSPSPLTCSSLQELKLTTLNN